MKNHSTRLIDGNFTHEQARRLLFQLLNDKINYHYIEKVSNEERFGKDLEHSDKRINQLSEEKLKLTRWLSELPSSTSIKINCIIQMEVEE